MSAVIDTESGLSVFSKAMNQIINPPRGILLNRWPRFNELTGGLREHELSIFCGNTGAGKTQFLANLTTQLLEQGEKTFVASVETGATDFGIRMISVLAGRDLNTGEQFAHGVFKNAVEPKMDALQRNLFFSTHENRVDVIDMIETLKFMSEKNGVKVAVMDNLNFFLKVSKAADMNQAYDEAVHNFVIAVKKLPMHIFLVMHPKKTESKTTQKILSEFDIKGSSTAVQEAGNVLLMNRLDPDEIGPLGTMFTRELVFKKIRKRGFNVNKKFYLDYVGGVYVERQTKANFIR
jgi:twinkle protein